MVANVQTLRTRYPGSRPFDRADESVFFGRNGDIDRLTTFISVENTTVLYGKSGLGKTSLLNAGVLPKLEREQQYRIIPLRFGSYIQSNLTHPLDIVEEQIAKSYQPASFLNKIESESISLWQHIKSLESALPKETCLVLVFDQFEELFTYPRGINDFGEALADLLYGRVPKSFSRALRLATRNDSDLLTQEEWDLLERPVNLKTLMSIRSDRMSLIDSLSAHIPGILLHCYELKPLSRAQAEEAIINPSRKAGEFRSSCFTYQPEALETILDYLTQNNTKTIESFQLQTLCQYVEENIVIAKNDVLVENEDLGDLGTIYRNYYDNSISKLGTAEEQLKARILIEEGLIFEREQRRIALYEGQILTTFGVNPDLLRRLADTHIIRSEPHSSGGFMYEVSHDTLVTPILKAKDRRYQGQKEERAREEVLKSKAKRRKVIGRAIVLLGGLVALCAIILAWTVIAGEPDEREWSVFVALFIFCFALLLLTIPASLLFAFEMVAGESVLTKLRKLVENPTKQKGLLTKLGRWLS
jgi:hypothetical protein